MIETDVLVIGGGVLGLSSVNQIPPGLRSIVVEKNVKCGQEASARNSEVIHSGIYYPHGSSKTEHCKIGRNELYRFCQKNQIAYRQCGKYLVATSHDEETYLENISKHCEYEVVPFQRVSGEWITKKLDLVRASSALYFPLSGVFDSHQYLKCLEAKALQKGTTVVTQTEFVKVLDTNPWVVELNEKGTQLLVRARILINASGFNAAHLCNSVLHQDRYQHRPCRGRYFLLKGFFKRALDVLVYPVPEKDGLGIHLTPDLEGNARLGPDTEWVGGLETDWDTLKDDFVMRVRKYLPSLKPQHLEPGFIGIRPKLFIDGQPFGDFLLHKEQKSIHLLGIESPGLTASLSLGAQVGRWAEENL